MKCQRTAVRVDGIMIWCGGEEAHSGECYLPCLRIHPGTLVEMKAYLPDTAFRMGFSFPYSLTPEKRRT